MTVALDNLTAAVNALITYVKASSGLQAQLDAANAQIAALTAADAAVDTAEQALADQANAALAPPTA
jgi:prefoldin subunit 5